MSTADRSYFGDCLPAGDVGREFDQGDKEAFGHPIDT
jgi:CheY-like chemotaxis protein